MRRPGLVALLSAVLAVVGTACAPGSQPRVSALPESSVPLEARIFPPYYGQVALKVSKPAYVALFEVVPGRGASLLYPQHGTGFTQVAETWVPMRYNAQRWMYASAANTSYVGYAGYGNVFSSGAFHPVPQAPRYLFLVASEDPMAIERFQGEVGAIREYLGYGQYTSMHADETMERLALAILPYLADDRWVTDVFVDWGFDWGSGAGLGAPAAFTSMAPVLCASGVVMYAPWSSGWGFQSLPCMPMQWVPGSGPGVPVTPPVPGDSTAPPPSGEGRRRAEGNADGERRRVTTGATTTITDEGEIRSFVNRQLEEGRRARVSDALAGSLRDGVRLRQRADAARGGRGPVATRDQYGPTEPAAGAPRAGSARPATADGRDAPSRAEAESRRRARERAQVERERDAEARRRRDIESRTRETTRQPETRQPETRREPSAERGRGSPPPPSSPPPSSGGRTRSRPPA